MAARLPRRGAGGYPHVTMRLPSSTGLRAPSRILRAPNFPLQIVELRTPEADRLVHPHRIGAAAEEAVVADDAGRRVLRGPALANEEGGVRRARAVDSEVLERDVLASERLHAVLMGAVLPPQALDRSRLDDEVVRALGDLNAVLPVLGDVELADAPVQPGPNCTASMSWFRTVTLSLSTSTFPPHTQPWSSSVMFPLVRKSTSPGLGCLLPPHAVTAPLRSSAIMTRSDRCRRRRPDKQPGWHMGHMVGGAYGYP